MDQNNFLSINNLVEFGMGMAIAQQMVQSMNYSMANFARPNEANNMIPTQETSLFYAVLENKQIGPLSQQDISQLVKEKKIVNETYMWRPGMADWDIAEKIPEILRIVALTPPPLPKK